MVLLMSITIFSMTRALAFSGFTSAGKSFPGAPGAVHTWQCPHSVPRAAAISLMTGRTCAFVQSLGRTWRFLAGGAGGAWAASEALGSPLRNNVARDPQTKDRRFILLTSVQ